MVKFITQLDLNTEQVKAIYQAISNKMRSKTCYVCLKLKLEIEGTLVAHEGDLSKPKRFVCKECL